MKGAIGIALAVLVGTGAAGGKEISTSPILRIETGMHTAIINRIAVDTSGSFLATGSNDKTVRVWDLASGQLLRTLRPPIGEGDEGKIYAVAISPDGELVAAGGWTSYQREKEYSIYLFERRSGLLTHRLSGLPDIVLHLAFSPDGLRLAATLGGTNGIRVYQVTNPRELSKDAAYGAASYGASFSSNGQLVTTSFDGKIRLYDRDLHLLNSASAPRGKQPLDVAFSPDGRRIAVGYFDTPRVDVLDAANLNFLYAPDTRGTNANFSSVAWSLDGTVLYAAGRTNEGEDRSPIRRWAEAGRGAFQDLTDPAAPSWTSGHSRVAGWSSVPQTQPGVCSMALVRELWASTPSLQIWETLATAFAWTITARRSASPMNGKASVRPTSTLPGGAWFSILLRTLD